MQGSHQGDLAQFNFENVQQVIHPHLVPLTEEQRAAGNTTARLTDTSSLLDVITASHLPKTLTY